MSISSQPALAGHSLFSSCIKNFFAASLVCLATGSSAVLAQDVPAGYASDYADVIKAAKAEGAVTIYTSTDAAASKNLVEEFTKKYGIKVTYNDLGNNGAYNQVISEAAANQTTADIVWSSAMDLQMTLVKDGYASSYKSPETKNIPEWANHKDSLYATTVEPIGILFNTKGMSKDRLPKKYAEMITFLQTSKDLKGKVATFDPKSGAGFLFHSNDARERKDFWDLVKAMGGAEAKIYSSSGAMKETVVSGENIVAINVIGSYAMKWAKESPNLGAHFMSDYTPAFSRPALIVNKAPHPNAAKLFLDFMLSKDGQTALTKTGLPSVRKDVEGLNIETLNKEVGGNLKPIALDTALLEYMAPDKRSKFFEDWKTYLGR